MTKRDRPTGRHPVAMIEVYLSPRGGRDAIDGWQEATLRVRVAAPPIDGRANAALVRLIARVAGVPARDVSIASGATSRRKRIAITGLSQAEAERRLDRET